MAWSRGFVYHDPPTDRLSLIPWGADSTFIYATPTSADNPDCQPLYMDVLTTSPVGWLGEFCEADPTCQAALYQKMAEVADWLEATDLVAQMETTRDRLDPYARLETSVNWSLDDREQRVACFLTWTAQRPDELRRWIEQR